MPNNRETGTVENLIEVEKIRRGTVFLKNGELRRILMVSGINFDLKDAEEQAALVYGFQDLVNALEFPIQITISSRKVSIEDYLARLKEREAEEESELIARELSSYRDFVASFVKESAIMEKRFFVTVPLYPLSLPSFKKRAGSKIAALADEVREDESLKNSYDRLTERTDQVISGLRAMGLRAVVLGDGELKDLFANLYNARIKMEKSTAPELAPERAEIRPTFLKINETVARTVFALSFPRFLSSGWLSPLVNFTSPMDIALHISPVDTALALKGLVRKVALVESDLIEREEKGLVRDPLLETALQDIETLRDELQQAREKLFSVAIYITLLAESHDDLRRTEAEIVSLMGSKLVSLKPALFEQRKGWNATLPILRDEIGVTTPFTSGPLSTLFPFVSATLTSDEGILYGLNRHNNTLIIFDRFSLENANMVVLAKAGSGKSYATKLEVIRSLMLGTDVIIIDPENEYEELARAVGGSYFKIALDSKDQINPLDLPAVPKDETVSEALRSHVVNLTGLLKLMLGEVSAEEEALLDRALAETYAARDITGDRETITGVEPPLLEDLEAILKNLEGGREMADRLYRFTRGSYAGFLNRPTNINIKNRLIVFSIRDLEDELRPIAMYIILNFIWSLVRAELKKRILVVDEAWWLMKYEDSASFLFGLAKRARKYYLGISTITQDAGDFLNSPYGKPIITNSSLQLLLKQAPAAIEETSKAFGLSEAAKNYLLDVDVGQGLFIAGPTPAAIQIIPSEFEHSIITTNPEEVLARERARESRE